MLYCVLSPLFVRIGSAHTFNEPQKWRIAAPGKKLKREKISDESIIQHKKCAILAWMLWLGLLCAQIQKFRVNYLFRFSLQIINGELGFVLIHSCWFLFVRKTNKFVSRLLRWAHAFNEIIQQNAKKQCTWTY